MIEVAPQLQHFSTAYTEIKFWLPLLGAFGIVMRAYVSAKKNVTAFADKLLSNHLAHIEEATVSTEALTQQTNVLLKDSAGKLDMVQNTLSDHHEKQLIVWQGVAETLAILKERTRVCAPSRRKKVK